MGEQFACARIALHFDEEPCISGQRGSGAVFLSGCAMRCVYCQNRRISHDCFGAVLSREEMRESCLSLVRQGAHNINFVNPTHYAHALYELLEQPLGVPIVWNSSGYERVETLKRIGGRVQIYLPDLKYADDSFARAYSGAADYFEIATRAILEMHRQVGEMALDENGVAQKGLMIRHLILPGHVDNSLRVLDWIARSLPGAWVSLMAQYTPCGEARMTPPLHRKISEDELRRVTDHLFSLGLENGYVQRRGAAREGYVPAFDLTGVGRG